MLTLKNSLSLPKVTKIQFQGSLASQYSQMAPEKSYKGLEAKKKQFRSIILP